MMIFSCACSSQSRLPGSGRHCGTAATVAARRAPLRQFDSFRTSEVVGGATVTVAHCQAGSPAARAALRQFTVRVSHSSDGTSRRSDRLPGPGSSIITVQLVTAAVCAAVRRLSWQRLSPVTESALDSKRTDTASVKKQKLSRRSRGRRRKPQPGATRTVGYSTRTLSTNRGSPARRRPGSDSELSARGGQGTECPATSPAAVSLFIIKRVRGRGTDSNCQSQQRDTVLRLRTELEETAILGSTLTHRDGTGRSRRIGGLNLASFTVTAARRRRR
eukprot:763932-Hanusia_phi.AAC.6